MFSGLEGFRVHSFSFEYWDKFCFFLYAAAGNIRRLAEP